MNSWPDLSGWVEPAQREAVAAIDRAAAACGADWFVAGATARDWVLAGIHGIQTLRATHDADFGVAVADWVSFERLGRELARSGPFVPDPHRPERFNHTGAAGFHIDLVPFGDLEAPPGEIRWRPENAVVMNVLGFRDTLDHALRVSIAPELTARVASLPGLTLLKLLAWNDRHLENAKDAWDLRLLLEKYEEAGNRERIWDEGAMAGQDHDGERAAAWLLGADVARLAGDRARAAALALLARELDPAGQLRLPTDLARATPHGAAVLDGGAAAERWTNLLTAFQAGLAA